MFIRLFLIILHYVLINVYPQESTHKVTIRLHTIALNDSSKIYISGNEPALGNWSPDSIELEKKKEYWEKELEFSSGELIEFKFTLGSWETEALDDAGKIPKNREIVITSDTIVTYYITSWKNPETKDLFKGQITGTVLHHSMLDYEGLPQRNLVVWLPPDYYNNLDKRYPVLYMHDGQNIFDPVTSFNNTDWQIDETADSLIKNGTIEPLIIVGIYNTNERSNEYADTEKAKLYHEFILKSVKPH
ncbi:MAG: alpha/beta hydrolase-fold protein, partial [Melioribacteraceae bacterium]|nr:alpha/beta hydrolase-fold protein [Melioribacteraceae bacterium]